MLRFNIRKTRWVRKSKMNIVVSDAHKYTVELSEDPQVKSDEEIIIIYYICIILLRYLLLKLTTLHLPAKMLVIVLNRSQRGNSGLKNLKFHPESADPKRKSGLYLEERTNKKYAPGEMEFIDNEEEIELHRDLTKELLQFAHQISDDEFCVMKKEIEEL